ncbi:MAG TPA: DNA-directed RNA polymerase subunit alpha [Candidatus Brocadiia bacterium]|nr:DNA-directed RNA polymerase subunit alpha [Candidatus Brocadiia bacterium]
MHQKRVRWRNLELPYSVIPDPEKPLQPTYGRFMAEPFVKGFGHTIGNSLRRVLLSSLEGSAISFVRIAGVEQEYSSIPGVVEDVCDIILNIKGIVVVMEGDGPQNLRLEVHKAGKITAADIQPNTEVRIVNPEHHIATLTSNVDIRIDMQVERGRGYMPASERKLEEQEIGTIAVDSLFSPVRRVAYSVEATRVGQVTNYDRLVMEIWTNGAVKPEDALVESAKILRKHLNPFVGYFELGAEMPAQKPAELGRPMEELEQPPSEPDDPKLKMALTELQLSVRASNCLDSAGIRTVAELVAKTGSELLALRNFGKTSLKEVQQRLTDMGLSLAAEE